MPLSCEDIREPLEGAGSVSAMLAPRFELRVSDLAARTLIY